MIQVWYHTGCTDGFGAAWAARKHFLKKNIEAKYIPLDYDDSMPSWEEGDTVYMVDYCRKPADLITLLDGGAEVIVLDHHKSALENINELPNEYLMSPKFTHVLDMTHSGAMVTWQYFHGRVDPPAILTYIQDRDLWQWHYPATKAVIMGLFSEEFDFEKWDIYAVNYYEFEKLIERGEVLVEYRDKQIKDNAKSAYLVDIPQHGLTGVPVVNTLPELRSDVCHELLQMHPDAPIAIAWFTRGRVLQFSLRSRGEVDVSAIARLYGGGGHHSAAGVEGPFIVSQMLSSNGYILNLEQQHLMSTPCENHSES
jgi:oligoribonuclease NrnB/cAMP/cGMP phosphodiesterase (DHH superfamily)